MLEVKGRIQPGVGIYRASSSVNKCRLTAAFVNGGSKILARLHQLRGKALPPRKAPFVEGGNERAGIEYNLRITGLLNWIGAM